MPLAWFNLYEILEKVKQSSAIKSRTVVVWDWSWEEGVGEIDHKGHKGISGGVEVLNILIVVVITWCIHLSKLIELHTSMQCNALQCNVNLKYASIKLIFKKAFSCSHVPCQPLFFKAPEAVCTYCLPAVLHRFSSIHTSRAFVPVAQGTALLRTVVTSMLLLDPMVSSQFSHLTWPAGTSHTVHSFFLESLSSSDFQDTTVFWFSFHLWLLFLSILRWFSWSSQPSTVGSALGCSSCMHSDDLISLNLRALNSIQMLRIPKSVPPAQASFPNSSLIIPTAYLTFLFGCRTDTLQ